MKAVIEIHQNKVINFHPTNDTQNVFEKINREYGRETNEDEINAGIVELEGGYTIQIVESNLLMASSPTADSICRVVLRYCKGGTEIVSHLENLQCGGYSHGYYFSADEQEKAIVSYIARCKANKVNPLG